MHTPILKGASLNKISEKVSSTVSNLIPGEGLTEVDINMRDANFSRLKETHN